jgi:glycosyltransferase involved in cell wall biosynthesis
MRPRICVYIPSFSDGGVEKMMVTLAGGFASAGFPTDFVTRTGELPYLNRLDPAVRLLRLPRQLPETLAYLKDARPAILMSAKGKDDVLALDARDAAGTGVRVFLRCGIHLSSRPKMVSPNPLRRWWHARRARALYARPDGVVCVSDGVADDLHMVTGVGRERLTVIRNPTLTPAFQQQLDAPCPHPWFAPRQRPVILAAGSLARVKRFGVLLEAAAPLLMEQDLRLVILGEGKERSALQSQAQRLGIGKHVDLPGFVGNVLPYMRRAALFVLSSEREGSPNVLTEALACGTPVVATDCPSGPREILADGLYGPLIPIGDPLAMRHAIAEVLQHPHPADHLRKAVAAYTLERACEGYLQAFGLTA